MTKSESSIRRTSKELKWMEASSSKSPYMVASSRPPHCISSSTSICSLWNVSFGRIWKLEPKSHGAEDTQNRIWRRMETYFSHKMRLSIVTNMAREVEKNNGCSDEKSTWCIECNQEEGSIPILDEVSGFVEGQKLSHQSTLKSQNMPEIGMPINILFFRKLI